MATNSSPTMWARIQIPTCTTSISSNSVLCEASSLRRSASFDRSSLRRTKTTGERISDFPASLGRRPVTFAQIKRHGEIYRKLKSCRKTFPCRRKSTHAFVSSSRSESAVLRETVFTTTAPTSVRSRQQSTSSTVRRTALLRSSLRNVSHEIVFA